MLAVSENTVHFSDKKIIFTLHLTLTLLLLVFVCAIGMVMLCYRAACDLCSVVHWSMLCNSLIYVV